MKTKCKNKECWMNMEAHKSGCLGTHEKWMACDGTARPKANKEPVAEVPCSALLEAAALAKRFHETYENLAPQFNYKTREESKVPWSEVPEANKNLMIATCAELLKQGI